MHQCLTRLLSFRKDIYGHLQPLNKEETPALKQFEALCRRFQQPEHNILHQPITPEEVRRALEGLKNLTAPGPDGLIGTTNLLSIGRGSVRIETCPNLCYVDTINWKALGAIRLDNKEPKNNCPPCPPHCNGLCWNSTHCMKTEKNCHKECLGCFKLNSPKHCKVCKHFKDDGVCVSQCPKHKYKFLFLQECYTKEECENFNLQNQTYWTHENECINECPAFHEIETISIGNTSKTECRFCGTNCKKECEAEPIESLQVLETLKGCTHIMGSLIIKKSDVEPKDLYEYLGAVRYISGTLEIVRTVRISSLDFLRNVTYIGINDANYSIFMYENQNLQKLWNFTTINLTLKGKIRFHDNPLLCLSEIEKLANSTNVSYSEKDVSPFSNGDEASCITVEMQIQVFTNSTNATINWVPPELEKDESYISFTVYYKEEKERNATVFNSIAVCVINEWTNIFTFSNSTVINNLQPNSTYAFYIKLHLRSNTYRKDAQTHLKYFQTLSDDPDGFETFIVTPTDYQTINLVWKKPSRPNGILETYILDYVKLEDVYLFDRDYCMYPRSLDGDYINYDESEQQSNIYSISNNQTDSEKQENNCSCPSKTGITDNEDFSIVTKDGKSKLCVDLAKSANKKYKCKNLEYFPVDSKQPKNKFEKRNYEHLEISPNLTSYNLTNLKPYSLYIFYFSACNKGNRDERHCSGILQRFARTKKRPNADNVADITIEPQGDSSLKISWKEPKNPNSVIVAYRINITLNSSNSASDNFCLRMNATKNGLISKIYNGLSPGQYIVSVQAESLAGYSNFSKFKRFDIQSPNHQLALLAVSISCLLVISATIVAYLLFRRRRMDGNYLITTINPEYERAVYIPDHWEMDRSDIELGKEIGRGNFGIVLQGRIKSRDQLCAVKVLNQSLNVYQRMEFLQEAKVMKSFSDCYHVIKLIGVVSLEQPILFVIELMERGDLKKYLRQIRDSSHNLTSLEIYRMAVEIADGMAYLAANKFIHRDLAARNCMVAGDRTVKVGDFGMARDVYTTDYYRKESKGLLPIRWMAPESLADGVFTSDSDVWSYGVVLWEIATLAELPYQGLSNEQVRDFIISRGRLIRPPECSDLLYKVMKQCWSWRPCDRPSFWDIVELLENRVSEDFKLVSFVYSRDADRFSRQRTENPAALTIEPREDLLCHYNVSDEDVSLPVGGVPRPPSYLQASISHKRFTPPDDFYDRDFIIQ